MIVRDNTPNQRFFVAPARGPWPGAGAYVVMTLTGNVRILDAGLPISAVYHSAEELLAYGYTEVADLAQVKQHLRERATQLGFWNSWARAVDNAQRFLAWKD